MSKRAKTKLEKESINPFAVKALKGISDDELGELIKTNIYHFTIDVQKGRLLSEELTRRGFYMREEDIKEIMKNTVDLIGKDKDLFGLNEKGC